MSGLPLGSQEEMELPEAEWEELSPSSPGIGGLGERREMNQKHLKEGSRGRTEDCLAGVSAVR